MLCKNLIQMIYVFDADWYVVKAVLHGHRMHAVLILAYNTYGVSTVESAVDQIR